MAHTTGTIKIPKMEMNKDGSWVKQYKQSTVAGERYMTDEEEYSNSMYNYSSKNNISTQDVVRTMDASLPGGKVEIGNVSSKSHLTDGGVSSTRTSSGGSTQNTVHPQ